MRLLSDTQRYTTDPEYERQEDNTLDLPGLREALEEALSENLPRQHSQQAASPVTPEPTTPVGSLSPTTPRPERMESAGTNNQAQGQMIALSMEQFNQLLNAARQPHSHPVRIREPEVFTGDRKKLRGFLVQLKSYFDWNNWKDDTDSEDTRIEYATSLLREGAEKWITPYVEGKTPKTWTTWREFENILRQQFGDIDAKEAARNELEKMKQRGQSMTDYWNNFRLVATDAEFDDATLGRLLLKGINRDLQEAWAHGDSDFTTTEAFAQWAIKKENRLNMVKHIQGSQPTPRQQEVPRNANGTFKPLMTSQGGDAMDLDAMNKRRFNRLPDKEWQRRTKEGLCLKCGAKGHRIKECRKGAWIKEMTVEEESKRQLKEEGPQ